MTTDSLFQSLGTELVWQAILAGFAVIAAVAAGIPLAQGRRVHPLLLLSGALLVAATPFVMGRLCLWDFGGLGVDTLRLQATTFAAVHLLAPLTAAPAIGLGLLFHALAGARSRPRPLAPALASALLLLVATGAVVAAGWSNGNWLYASLRGSAYVVFGSLAVLGSVGSGPPEEGGRDAGAAAACALPVLVALGEASQRGLVTLLLTQVTASVPTGKWSEGLQLMLGRVETEWTVSRAALVVACLAAVPGCARAGRRGAVTWAVAVGVSAALLLGSDLGARAEVLSALVP